MSASRANVAVGADPGADSAALTTLLEVLRCSHFGGAIG